LQALGSSLDVTYNQGHVKMVTLFSAMKSFDECFMSYSDIFPCWR